MKEGKSTSLVVSNNNSLAKASNFIQITNKLLAEINKTNYDNIDLVDFLANKSKKDVYEYFGESIINKNNTETFLKHGLVFKFNQQDKIKSICATKLSNGVTFTGKLVYKIGDDIGNIHLLDKGYAEHENPNNSKTIIIPFGEFILELEVSCYSQLALKDRPELIESYSDNNRIQRIELRKIGEIEATWPNNNYKARRTFYMFSTFLNKTWRSRAGKLTKNELDDFVKIKRYLQNKPSILNQVLRHWQNEHIYFKSNEVEHQNNIKDHMTRLEPLLFNYFSEEIKNEL